MYMGPVSAVAGVAMHMRVRINPDLFDCWTAVPDVVHLQSGDLQGHRPEWAAGVRCAAAGACACVLLSVICYAARVLRCSRAVCSRAQSWSLGTTFAIISRTAAVMS